MKKKILTFSIIAIFLAVIVYAGSGVMNGDFTVNGNVNANQVSAPTVCVDGDCKSTWPQTNIGDITAVIAGTGLTGGATSGSATLNVDSSILENILPTGAVIPFNLATCPTGWSEFTQARGRVVTGKDSSQTEFDTLGETGGEKTHTLTVNEIPAHSHDIQISHLESGSGEVTKGSGHSDTYQTDSEGGGQPHNNLQPYVTLLYCVKN